MRRCLHSLLIGVLSCSLAIDAARACGHRRHRCRPACPPPVSAVCPAVAWDDCAADVVAAGCGGCGEIETPVSGPCGAVQNTVSPDAVAAVAAPVGESVITPPPAVTPRPPVAAAVPDLEPVEPVSAVEDAAATMPTDEPPAAEEPVEDETPALPPRRNAFEESDDEEGIDTTPLDAAAVDDPDAMEIEPTDPAAEPAADPQPEPALDDPSSPPDLGPGPALEPEPAAAAEPLRRWIDDTASHAIVGRLVDVGGDRVGIRTADGREFTVSLDRLSGFDRDYVAAAGPRVAAARSGTPRPTDTAQR